MVNRITSYNVCYTKLLRNHSDTGAGSVRRWLRTGLLAAVALTVSSAAQAFPSLNLNLGQPDISAGFIDVTYTGDANSGTLGANGFAMA